MQLLNAIEELEQELYFNAVKIVEGDLPYGLKGIYHNDRLRGLIVLTTGLPGPERLSVLAEEAGHYYTTIGNILSLDQALSRKLERRARGWACERLVPPEGIITAWYDYVRTPWELAEYFGVTHRFFADAITYYQQKHAPAWHVDEYMIIFEPFSVAKHQPQ